MNKLLKDISKNSESVIASAAKQSLAITRLLRSFLPRNDALKLFSVFALLALLSAPASAQTAGAKKITLSFAEDSVRTVTASVTDSAGAVADAGVKFFVQRMFSLLPLNKKASLTDEEGRASVIFPKDLPGDRDGNVIIIAQMEDEDTGEIMEAKTKLPWGVPLQAEANPFPRALWEPQAPSGLILAFSVIFGGIWLTYFFIWRQLFIISRRSNDV